MRKLFWFSAAAAVAAATGVYFTADHAAKNPGGYWSHCFNTVAAIGAHCNPFWTLERLTAEHRQVPKPVAAHAPGMLPGIANAIAGHHPDKPVEGAEPADAGHEPIHVECRHGHHGERIHIEFTPCEPEVVVTEKPFDVINGIGVAWMLPVDEKPMLFDFEECEAAHERIPAPMPEAELIPAPVCEDLGECRAGVCAWFWKMMQAAGLVRQKPCLPEMIPAPTEECEVEQPAQEPASEEQEPAHRVHPHHQHHGGCPYMGRPYHYNYTPPVPQAEPECEKPIKLRKKKVVKKEPVCKETMLKKLLGPMLEEDAPVHQGIDTMDFRPSDDLRFPWGPGSF